MINIYSTSHTDAIPYKMFKFSGGEVQVSLQSILSVLNGSLTIEADLDSSDAIMELILVTDALRRIYSKDNYLRLVCPYLPYARQDRVMNLGEALGLKVMCDLINGLKFDEVNVWDVHSDVALALLDRVRPVEQHSFTQRIPVEWKNTILVAPDAGALKKVYKTAKQQGSPVVRADKTRSVVDGSITGTVVYSEHVGDKDFLILDDICDGGRTFIELAKELRKITDGKIFLYVTHGIFSKGLDVFDGLIDQVYVANPFPDIDLSNPILTVLNLR